MTALPGWSGPLLSNMYSGEWAHHHHTQAPHLQPHASGHRCRCRRCLAGYLHIPGGKHLHYIFIESTETTPATANVQLWLNGGPGACRHHRCRPNCGAPRCTAPARRPLNQPRGVAWLSGCGASEVVIGRGSRQRWARCTATRAAIPRRGASVRHTRCNAGACRWRVGWRGRWRLAGRGCGSGCRRAGTRGATAAAAAAGASSRCAQGAAEEAGDAR